MIIIISYKSNQKYENSLYNDKGSFKKYVRWGEGGGNHWKANKSKQGQRAVLAFVYVHFLKKMLRFSKWSFVVILQFFLLIIMAIWNIKPSWKIIIFSPVNEWQVIAFVSHKVDTFVMHQWCPLYRNSTVAS